MENENKEGAASKKKSMPAKVSNPSEEFVSSEKIEEDTESADKIEGPINIGSTNSAASLQSRFLKFKNERQKVNKKALALKQSSHLHRTDPNFKANLRSLFLATARKYFGTPYSKKYHPPGSQYHKAPLYLDCCALVRRCVWDLREYFGFTLLPYNQNYQFELLPISLEFNQMQPGDLIFYEATYYPGVEHGYQIHDLTHVEIFVGGETGEESIGARWGTGVVSQFPSYKFESKRYYDVKHHFRSIDTWLEGICKSHFPQTTFGTVIELDPHKKSLFGEEGVDEDGEVEPSSTVAIPVAPFYNSPVKLCYVGSQALAVEKFLREQGWQVLRKDETSSPMYHLKWACNDKEVGNLAKFNPAVQMVISLSKSRSM